MVQLSSFVSLAVLATVVSAQEQFSVITPGGVTVCRPLKITFTGGDPPFFISVRRDRADTGATVIDFPQQDGREITWLVNIEAGTTLGLSVRDRDGDVTNSAAFPVGDTSADKSCVGKSSSISTPSSTRNSSTSSSASPSSSSTISSSTSSITAPPSSTTSSLSTSSSSSSSLVSSAPASATSSAAPSNAASSLVPAANVFAVVLGALIGAA